MKKIIIADESSDIRQNLKDSLSSEGFIILETDNGDEALDIALESNPRLIIAEADMPIMDGWSLCANIQAYEEVKKAYLGEHVQ